MRFSRSTRKERAACQSQPLTGSWGLLLSTYCLVFCACLMISVAQETYFYAALALAVCALHALVGGPRGFLHLPAGAANAAALLAFALSLLENRLLGKPIILCLGHFLMAVLFITLYERKPIGGYRLMQVVGLLLLSVSAATTDRAAFLPAFLACVVALVWNYMSCELEQGRQIQARGPGRPQGPALGRWGAARLLRGAVANSLVLFLCTAVLFLLFPRFQGRGFGWGVRMRPIVGFSDRVSLRDMEKLRESDEKVMEVKFTSEYTGGPILPSPILMRGRCLEIYRDGNWYDSSSLPGYGGDKERTRRLTLGITPTPHYLLSGVWEKRTLVRQDVVLEPFDTPVLFALYRPLDARVEGIYPVRFDRMSHSLKAFVWQPGPLHYWVVSLLPEVPVEKLRQAAVPEASDALGRFLQVPEQIRPDLARIARDIEAAHMPESDYDRVMAVVRYLADPVRFRYTLAIPDTGETDPLLAFLTQTRRGNCEHFSSAMALLLRIWQIPTRLVTGFSDGEYDPDRGTYVFLQKHAHAWVEVLFEEYGWIPFDPTPASPGVAAGVWEQGGRYGGGLIGALKRLVASLKGRWWKGVVDYGREQQKMAASAVIGAARGLAGGGMAFCKNAWAALAASRFALLSLILSLTAVAGVLFYLFGRFVRRSTARGVRGGRAMSVWFYRDMLAALEKRGLVRAQHLTPREFAELAARELLERAEDPAPLVEALRWITNVFCQVRFGMHRLSSEEDARLRAELRILRH